MQKLYIVIGRFQMPHIGHINLIDNAIERATQDNAKVLVLIGSSNKSLSLDNPMNYHSRQAILSEHYQHDDIVYFAGLRDYDYNNAAWEQNLHNVIKQAAEQLVPNQYFEPVFMSSDKQDDDLARQSWARGASVVGIPAMLDENDKVISATRVRGALAVNGGYFLVSDILPQVTKTFLDNNRGVIDFLQKEAYNVHKYKESWKKAPFAPTFMATDAVLRDSNGNFLIIERGGDMGKGQLALAGGFLEQELTHEENMRKETLEETGLDLNTCKNNIVVSWFCDAPKRAKRGRMTTMVYLVDVEGDFHSMINQGTIQAGDDAAGLHVHSLEELQGLCLFNDHMGLLEKVLLVEQEGHKYSTNS